MNFQTRQAIPWVAPMLLFVALNVLEGKVPSGLYPVAYCAKIILVLLCLVISWKSWRGMLALNARTIGVGLIAGFIGLVAWLAFDLIPYPKFGSRIGFNPFAEIQNLGLRSSWITARLVGLALVVPLIEEVFWRGFLGRYVDNADDFTRLTIGNHSVLSTAIVCTIFASIHPEWLAAVVYALLTDQVLRRTKSLGACVVMHATTNALLGVYVLKAGAWHLW